VLPEARRFSRKKPGESRKAILPFIRLVRKHERFFEPLRQINFSDPEGGAPRLEGDWWLVHLCMVVSGSLIAPCHDQYSDPTDETAWAFWRACGFCSIPSQRTAYNRLIELEAHHGAFRACARLLMEHARAEIPDIGVGVMIDCTEAGVNVALHYFAPNLDGLTEKEQQQARAEGRKRRKAHFGRPLKMGAEEARQERADEVDLLDPEGEFPDLPAPGEVTRRAHGDVARVRTYVQYTDHGRKRDWTLLLLGAKKKGGQWVGGHWYGFLDPTAGVRFHGKKGTKNPKFWLGFYHLKVIDICTGAVLLSLVECASVNEFLIWLERLDEVIEHLGRAPKVVTADKGFDIKKVAEEHARRMIGSAISLRDFKGDPAKVIDLHDPFGLPTCPECGNPGRPVKFSTRDGNHWLYVCTVNPEGTCHAVDKHGKPVPKRFATSKDPRRSGPVHRMSLAWHEWRQAHHNQEKAHDVWREWRIGGDDRKTRPRRKGKAWQQLLCDAALVLEWLLMNVHNGWLDGQVFRLPRKRRELERRYQAGAIKDFADIQEKWREEKWHLPRGKAGRRRYPWLFADPPPEPAT
jgi:hypothetical protein